MTWRAVAILAVAIVSVRVAGSAIAETAQRPGAAVEYRIERIAETGNPDERFTAAQLAVLEKLNRADLAHLRRLDQLVVPDLWRPELEYSPFPLTYSSAAHTVKLLLIDQPSQAFAAYEGGRLVQWGPISSGRRVSPTPSGFFHLNWRSPGRHSTVNPQWYMEWYFNFDNARGLSLHSYALPGYPASHACVRLLERDAIWIYTWGEPGTPVLIVGHYAFDAPAPWRSLEQLAHGIDLPDVQIIDTDAS